ncbi:MAG: CotH kinase family protein [Bacteroidetes bacterium]|nr:CotH kinase family protein [Bacteroidota bacterium]
MKKNLLLVAAIIFVSRLSAQTLTTSNLPIIIINTSGQPIPDEPKITADMGIIYNGEGVRNNVTDPYNHYNGKIGIEIRGESSQMFPMKSYSIELRDNSGNSKDKSLFGLPKESDWVLYAPYNDKTLMHNFLAYTMSREMGHWAANCRFVEMIIDGDYKGIYVFMEKLKRNSGRVNIPKMAATDISGDAVTGGYIISIDKDANAWYSTYKPLSSKNNQMIQFSYVYPKVEDIVTEQANYIKFYVDSFEAALYRNDYQDKAKGWRRFADEKSFIDYLLVNEVSRNVDAYRLSAYLYKGRQSSGGKLTAGPVWDYDLAFRNANYCSGSDSTGWAYDFNSVCPDDYWQIPFWWSKFKTDTTFQSDLRCRWKQLRQTSLSDSHLNLLVDSIVSLTAEARQRHFQRWPVLGQYVWPNPTPIPTTYDQEVAVLKDWLFKRMTWINNNLQNVGACYDYPNSVKESVIISTGPNPFRDIFYFTVKSRIDQNLLLHLTDVSGKVIYKKQQPVAAGINQLQVNWGYLSAGVYFCTTTTSSGEKTTIRLVKY